MAFLERRQKTRSRSLTAAAMRVERSDAPRLRKLVQPWQHRALAYYESLGEVNFAAQFYARTLSKIRYFAAELDENGDPQETTNPKLQELWARVQDPGGGRTNLLTAYGQLMFLCGDCYLVCSADDDFDEKWEILSVAELRVSGEGKWQRLEAPGLGFQELIDAPDDAFEPQGDEVIVYRLYRPDPRFRKLADAPMRGVLTLCEELVLLDLEVRSQAKSRIANAGWLLIADSISPPPPDAADDDPMADPFFRDLFNAMSSSIADPGSAAAWMPLITRVSSDLIEKKSAAQLVKFSDPATDAQQSADRAATVKRIATGLDMPPELLIGLETSNHWTSWMIDEQSWKAHLMPVTQRLCDDFASAYLRPAAKQDGIANWRNVVIGYDAAEVINHPDKAKDAFAAYAQRAVGKAYLRSAIGATDDDAMPEDELNEAIGVAVRDGSLAVYGIPSVKAGGIEPEPGEVVNPSGEQTAPAGPASGSEVEKGPPAAPPEPRTASAAPSLVPLLEVGKIVGAAESHIERARELAGNRLRNRTKGCKPCQDATTGQPASMVASVLGIEQTRDALDGHTSERDLVAGTAEAFAATAARMGVPDGWAAELADLVEAHAARTLYEPVPPPLPATFASLTARALTRQEREPEPVAA